MMVALPSAALLSRVHELQDRPPRYTGIGPVSGKYRGSFLKGEGVHGDAEPQIRAIHEDF